MSFKKKKMIIKDVNGWFKIAVKGGVKKNKGGTNSESTRTMS